MAATSPEATRRSAPVQYMKGIGPHRAALLEKLGIHSASDFLFYLPRSHQDRHLMTIRDARPGQKMAFRGVVIAVSHRRIGPQLGCTNALVQDATGSIEAVWFKHLSYKFDVFSGVKKTVLPGREVFLFGTADIGRKGLELRVDEFDPADDPSVDSRLWNTIVPLYPGADGLSDKWFRETMSRAVQQESQGIKDHLPRELREDQKLIPLDEALRTYHFPRTWRERDRARERLAFDEFFFLELALELSRQDRAHHSKGFVSRPTKKLLTPFKHSLGFDFTRSQVRAINEIFQDMARPSPMYRLLQGDVGSGKTCVALSAALLSVENDRQSVLLAPTEILAGQHKISVDRFFRDLPIRTALLTRSTPGPERQKILRDLKSGKLDFIVGTHAILNEEVAFQKLGLVIVDEQHRFGVRQRAKIIQKATQSRSFQEGRLIEEMHPDVLVMTATPIPRTLALTLYGDLDVSTLTERPGHRPPILTRMADEAAAIDALRKTVADGHRCYVVLPLIDESEKLNKRLGPGLKSAKIEYERLRTVLDPIKLGLLHGQMKGEEKRLVMERFRSGDIEVLVATPVIEVGIDVPEATTAVIMNPERFGLAQLHQLRGRVGRGPWPSQCLLVVSEVSEDSTAQRLNTFVNLSDGFKLAEEDLKLRGPGEILGEAQHGIPLFRVGDLVHDGLLIAQARNAAKRLVHGEIRLAMPEFTLLNSVLQRRYGDKLKLSHVG